MHNKYSVHKRYLPWFLFVFSTQNVLFYLKLFTGTSVSLTFEKNFIGSKNVCLGGNDSMNEWMKMHRFTMNGFNASIYNESI